MNFLLVNYEYPPIGGGGATASQAISYALRRAGHEVLVLTARFGDLPQHEIADGITIHRIRCRRAHPNQSTSREMLSFLLAAARALPRILQQQHYDAAIIFFSFPCGPIGLLAKYLRRVPYVVSLRGGDVPGAEPELATTHKLLQPLRRLILRNSVAVVANSNGLREMSLAADPIPVSVIPNGVDTEFFCPATDNPKSSGAPFRLLYVGRFRSQKNLSYLLKQLADPDLRKEYAGRLKLDLVGEGPMRAELEQCAMKLGLTSEITWHGWLRREQLREMYRRCDCFVNPSVYEGMPNSVLEAMACAKPVIASRVPGNEAVVQSGTTGFLFDLGEPGAFHRCLRSMINDPARAQKMGHAGRYWVEREFSWDRVAAAYAQLFEQRAA